VWRSAEASGSHGGSAGAEATGSVAVDIGQDLTDGVHLANRNLHMAMAVAKERLKAAMEHLKPPEKNKAWRATNCNSSRSGKSSASPFGAAASN
jgi:hypothetical protein